MWEDDTGVMPKKYGLHSSLNRPKAEPDLGVVMT